MIGFGLRTCRSVPDRRRLLQRSDPFEVEEDDRRRQTDGDALPCAETLDAANTHGRSDVEPPLESPAEEVTRLRDSLNDLRGIMALPALWTGGEPPRSVSASLDALLGIANELEERVAQRTRELAIAKEALRESERNSRLARRQHSRPGRALDRGRRGRVRQSPDPRIHRPDP